MRNPEKSTFDEWYAEQLGPRWSYIREALIREQHYYELADRLLKPYYLDEASYRAAKALGAEPGETVLDLCAAPGGKTLVVAIDLDGAGRLVANDRSSARRLRLRRVLEEHLPTSLRSVIEIAGHDAKKWGVYEPNVYDRVLLDAPCSSERHVLASPKHLSQWSPARTKHLAVQAHSMLAGAYDAAKPGGTVAYVTCALSPLENEGVIEKLKRKRPVSLDRVEMPFGEATAHGWQIWPDTAGGRGPMYISRIIKPPP